MYRQLQESICLFEKFHVYLEETGISEKKISSSGAGIEEKMKEYFLRVVCGPKVPTGWMQDIMSKLKFDSQEWST